MIQIPTIDMVKTGQNIIQLRKEKGLSVKDIQDIFGFSTPQAIYKWQQGTALPSLDNLVILAMIFSGMMGVVGIWCAWPVGWGIGTVVSLIFYKCSVKNNFITKTVDSI